MFYIKEGSEDLKHLQKVLLMILKDFIEICEENDLNYYVCGGTALGAVRHNGFIPWDDDVDVYLFRKDYEKFLEIVSKKENDKYTFVNVKTHDDYFLYFTKMMLNGTKFEEWWANQVNFKSQIFIDIFVLDNITDNRFKRFFQVKICRILDRLTTIAAIKLEGYPKSVQTPSNIIHNIFKLLKIKPITISNLNLKLMKINKDDNSKMVCDFSEVGRPAVYERKDFGKPIKIKFESIEINVAQNYNYTLSKIYGDYMKIPDKKDRINHKISELDFGIY